MRLKQDTDIPKFLADVRQCGQDVYFVTEEGDRLNLRSVLGQYILCTLVNEPEMLSHGRITFTDTADISHLSRYLEDDYDD